MLSSQEQRRRIAEELARIGRTANRRDEPVSPLTERTPTPCRFEPIAIIGLSGYLPGCPSLEAFWRALEEDRGLLEPVPQARLDLWHRLDPTWAEWTRIPGGGFLPDIRSFAPEFFGVLPGEAHFLDPRQRLLLMSVYRALEDAGYAPRSLRGQSVGVFVASEEDEYYRTMLDLGIHPAGGDGLASSMLANRLSWTFDFRGPSEVVNTMCSGGAVALHRAVNSLRSRESTLAVVGAANLLLRPEVFVQLSQTGQMSPELAVRSFGKQAQGFLRAEGVATVVLKRLSEAERDGDPIYGLIRHSAVNYNGRGGMSIAAPDIAAHAELILRCYREAGIDPRDLRYIEAQGMGNPVADLGEWQALQQALTRLAGERAVALPPDHCRVGTLKPMLGHMHSASALGALCKVVHCLRTRTIHRILGFAELNPDLENAGQPCAPARDTEPWPAAERPRLAGLHSYGAGGNNVHLLLQEYADTRATTVESGPWIVPVSAESEDQLRESVRNLLDAVDGRMDVDLGALARTLRWGRDTFPKRVAFVCSSLPEWISQARAYLARHRAPGTFDGTDTTLIPDGGQSPEALARAWIQGGAIPDRPAAGGLRLHLPGYPFALKDCWYDRVPTEPRAGLPAPPERGSVEATAESVVRDLLARPLECPPERVPLDTPFVDLGFSSLLVAELAAELRRRTSAVVEPARFFEFKRPRQLVQALAELLPESGPVESTQGTGTCERALEKASEPAQGGRAGFRPIAIVGLAGRYPGASSMDEFWDNLCRSRECITEVPESRWPVAEHFDPDPESAARNGKSYGKWGGFISGLHQFDPLFFRISPLEAETMNPKERWALQTVWHALEDAGHTPATLADRTVGVFFGVTRAGWDPYPGTFSSVANRVSYFCDFHGPSVSIDTMCSSSLVALHDACQQLQTGACDVAIAGGVNLYLHPSHFVVLAHGRFLSPDGKCRAFGAGANGMVPGEGVGAVVLRPLEDALREGDRVYAVIRGTACNHGGQANGYTVPNPVAQRDVVLKALAIAGVHPRHVTYVEAHGTGTSLGDPVEIRGLSEAYRRYTAERGYCRLGSLKSNLGHLEAAAGIASLTKVLLQMRHAQCVASLHTEALNPHIDFASTPFVVARTCAAWLPLDAEGRPLPRLAGVSSFGAGGSNAHLIVEEAPPEEQAGAEERPRLIVLSARTEDRLRHIINNLVAFLDRVPQVPLRDVAFTLQVGREAMEERFALVVESVTELRERLRLVLERPESLSAVYYGRVAQRGKAAPTDAPAAADSTPPLGDASRADLERLAKSWVHGAPIDGTRLFAGERPRRVGLPLYPFAEVTIPVPRLTLAPDDLPADTPPAGRATNPMVQPSTEAESEPPRRLPLRFHPTADARRFASSFDGNEFFLAHHVVEGRKTLPAAAYLEIARSACERSRPSGNASKEPSDGAFGAFRFRNVVWPRPFRLENQPREASIALEETSSGTVRFRIETPAPQLTDSPALLCQGEVEAGTLALPERIDLDTLRSSATLEFPIEQCYAIFSALGIDYGSGHRALQGLSVGPNLVVARLCLPDCLRDTLDDFVLHPSLLDGAFQATIGFSLRAAGIQPMSHTPGGNGNGHHPPVARNLGQIRPGLPYSIEQMEVHSAGKPDLWAVVRRATASSSSEAVDKFDLEICDDEGRVQIRILGFAARLLAPSSSTPDEPKLWLRIPRWEQEAETPPPRCQPAFERRVVLCCGLDLPMPTEWRQSLSADNRIWRHVRLQGKHLAKEFGEATWAAVEAIQTLAQARPTGNVLVQVLLPSTEAARVHTGLVGLLRTAHREFPRLYAQLVQLDSPPASAALARLLEANEACPECSWIRYRDGQREIATWTDLPGEPPAWGWRPNGVYLITGGLGGLGRIFAEEIARRAPGACVVLIGRSAPNAEGAAFLDALRDFGLRVEYRQLDLRQRQAVREGIQAIVRAHGTIHGILHAAGKLRDGYLVKESRRDLEAVLAPKVLGTVHLDEATRDLELDFFALFSSGAVLGNPGQGGYAAANAFLDGFATYRNTLAAGGARRGRTLSIAWPLWRDGGMRMNAEARRLMAENTGLVAMETPVGIEAFYRCLASGQERVLVLFGHVDRIRAALAVPSMPDSPAAPPEPEPQHGERPILTSVPGGAPTEPLLRTRVLDYLKQAIGETLKIPADQLRPDKDLNGYGLDSIVALEVNNRLDRDFARLSRTLFFEYSTVEELAGYFLQAHRPTLERMFGSPAPAPMPPDSGEAVTAPAVTRPAPELGESQTVDGLNRSVPTACESPRPVQKVDPPAPSFTPKEPSPAVAQSVSLDDLIRACNPRIRHPAPRPSPRAPAHWLWPNWYSLFQSFAYFSEVRPDFSFSRLLAGRDDSGADTLAYLYGQIDLRRALFHREDFTRIARIVDLGCGRAADLIELALNYPRLVARGLTIDADEAAFAQAMVRRQGLANRVRILIEDSTAHAFEPGYDLAFSIQTMHFIPELSRKRALLRKLAAALQHDGVLLMAEFVSLLAKPMRDPVLNTTVHTTAEYARLLGEAGFLLDEVLDLSAGIANALDDPQLESHIAALDEARQVEIRKFNRQIAGLRNRWVGYCVMRAARADKGRTTDSLIQDNLERFHRMSAPDPTSRPKTEGREETLYTDLPAHFGTCVATAFPRPRPERNPILTR